MLTHDFEPVTDFIVVGKISDEHAIATFIWNEDGKVSERTIDPNNDVCIIIREYEQIAKRPDVNIVSRVAFLRKLCELNGCEGDWGNAYEILSCLIHATEIRRKVGQDLYIAMAPKEIDSGMKKIREFINDFDYNDLKDYTYSIEGIKALYLSESNAYLKIQLFRAMCDVAKDKIKMTPFDDGWYKFIDETYHIENDYLHYLDILKFNIVPNYISKKVEEIVSNLSVKCS